MTPRTRIAALLIIAICSAGSPTRAADDVAYKQHADKARAFVRKQDRRGAIREFEAAYSASPKPEARRNSASASSGLI